MLYDNGKNGVITAKTEGDMAIRVHHASHNNFGGSKIVGRPGRR